MRFFFYPNLKNGEDGKMKENPKKQKIEEKIEELSQKQLSRRAFMGNTGKIIGLGIISHFAMLGSLSASEVSPKATREVCSYWNKFVCDGTRYTCQGVGYHECSSASGFTCQSRFECQPAQTNVCEEASINACVPTSLYNNPEA